MAQLLNVDVLLVFACISFAAAQAPVQEPQGSPVDRAFRMLANRAFGSPYEHPFDMPIMLSQADEVAAANQEEDEQPLFSIGYPDVSDDGPFESEIVGQGPYLGRGRANPVPATPIRQWLEMDDDADDDKDDDQDKYHRDTYFKRASMAAAVVGCMSVIVAVVAWRRRISNSAEMSPGLLEVEVLQWDVELDVYGTPAPSKQSAVPSEVVDEMIFKSLD